jgi:DNA-binding NarL/FixJ family response regulator
MRIRFRQHSTTSPRRLRVHLPALSRSSANDADPYNLPPDTRPEQPLTPRELEVLAMIADGAMSANAKLLGTEPLVFDSRG